MITRMRNKRIIMSNRMISRATLFQIGFVIVALLVGQIHTEPLRSPKHDRLEKRNAIYIHSNEDDDRHGTDPEEEDASNGPISGYSGLVSNFKNK